jgi:hypothetical protein
VRVEIPMPVVERHHNENPLLRGLFHFPAHFIERNDLVALVQEALYRSKISGGRPLKSRMPCVPIR